MSDDQSPEAELPDRARQIAARLIRERKEQEELANRAIAHLEQTWGERRACPYCENVEWEVATPLDIATTGGEALSPHFPVMCTNCGNTVLINAIRAGLIPEDEP